MKPIQLYWLPLLAIVAACGGSGDTERTPDPNLSAAAPSLPADAAIAALVYDSTYSVPPGFYVDERAGTSRSYTLHHVLDESGSYELCTDDYAVAAGWEALDNNSRTVQGYFVESYDNARYFEFARELAYDNDVGNIADTTSPGFARIFKCSAVSRDGVDRSLLTGYAGRLNAQPLTPETIRIFSEYLWQFAFSPASRKKVLASYGADSGTRLEHTLEIALAINQGAGHCDRMEIARWRFSADRTTGEVEKHFETVRTFEAKLESDIPVICP